MARALAVAAVLLLSLPGLSAALPADRRPQTGSASSFRVNGKERKHRSQGSASQDRTQGSLQVVRGRSRRHGSGRTLRFTVEVERGLRVVGEEFATAVEGILFSDRGWSRSGGVAFRRVVRGARHFRVILASRATTDRLCAPAQTMGLYSCHNSGLVVLNAWRWRRGAKAYNRLGRYRTYLVNHEVGHALGFGHRLCSGGRAPVMMQQTKGVGACEPNPWQLGSELP